MGRLLEETTLGEFLQAVESVRMRESRESMLAKDGKEMVEIGKSKGGKKAVESVRMRESRESMLVLGNSTKDGKETVEIGNSSKGGKETMLVGRSKGQAAVRGTTKVRNSGLGPDPDQSAKNGP